MTRPVRHDVEAVVAVVLALILALLAPIAVTRAASLLWSLTATPLTATVGVQHVFTLTATNEDPLAALDSSREIGCVVVDVPGTFTVVGDVMTGSNAGTGWHVDSVVGNRVTVHTDSGGERLELLDWVRFTITATPVQTGSPVWGAKAYRAQDCTGGAALLGVPPVVVVTPAPATPRPEPTPRPTPMSTPRPTPTPLPLPLPSVPLPSLPVPLPSIGQSPDPEPDPTSPPASSVPRPTPEPPSRGGEPRSPSPSPSPAPSAGSDADGGAGAPLPQTGRGGGHGGSGAGAGVAIENQAPRVAFDEPQLDLGATGIDVLAGIEIWSVPAATLGVPGILLIVWVALQAAGALAWIPAVRRLRGDEEVPT